MLGVDVGVGVRGGAADRHGLGQLPAPIGELLVQGRLPRPIRRHRIAGPQAHRVVGQGDGGAVVGFHHAGEAGRGAGAILIRPAYISGKSIFHADHRLEIVIRDEELVT